MTKQYCYDKHLLEGFIDDYKEKFLSYHNYLEENNLKLTTQTINYIIDNCTDSITDRLYFKVPNPSSTFKLLVYDSLEDKEIYYYCIYNNSEIIQKTLKEDYKDNLKEFDKENKTKYYNLLSFKKLMDKIPIYEETKINNQIILLNNGYTFNNKKLCFEYNSEDVPIKEIDKKYTPLTSDQEELLGTVFKIMYPEDTEYNKFLYYILSMLDKTYALQSIFLIIDGSGVGKTAKITPLVELQLSNMINSNMLKDTEIYNIFCNNSITVNEIQSESINGANLNNLADSSPYTVTRKNKDSITVTKEDKPVISIMGESQPYIKALSNGTNRRFLLVPKVSKQFIEYKNKPENKEIINKFYDMLYEHSTEVIEFYSKQIDIHNIKERSDEIRETMTVTPDKLEELIEVKEDIFSKYFNINPEYNNVLTETTYLIDSKNGLKQLLKYIDNNIVTVNHIGTDNGRKKYLNQLIKEVTGEKNLKNFGTTKIDGLNIYYAYSLTPEGVKLIEEVNKTLKPHEKIQYTIKYPPEKRS